MQQNMTDEQFGRLSRCFAELTRQIDNGFLELEATIRALLLLSEGRRPLFAEDSVHPTVSLEDSIRIPVLSPHELLALAKFQLDLTELDSSYSVWDFNRRHDARVGSDADIDIRNKEFAVLTWTPETPVSTDEVRIHFKAVRAEGNTNAFLAWIMQMNPKGSFATIPPNDFLWHGPETGHLYTPTYRNSTLKGRELRLADSTLTWRVPRTFVAFREISTAQAT